MPLLFLLLEKVVNLEVGLVDRLEGQTEVGLVDRFFVDGLVEDLAVDFLVFLEEVFLEDLMVGPVVLMEVGPVVLMGVLTVVGPEGLMADLMEVDLEGLMADLVEVDLEARLVGRMVGHLEEARVLQMYRDFLLQVWALQQEFLPLLLGPLPESLLILKFLLLAKPALLWELFQELPCLLNRQRLRQTYHLLQRFFHLL